MTLAPPQGNGAAAPLPPAGPWRDRDRYRRLGAELVGQPASEPAPKPPAEPAADDDQISRFLGRDLAQPGGRVPDGMATIGRCCDARLAGEPLEHTVGVVAPAIVGDMGEHEAKAETVAQLGREPKRSTRLIAVDHTTDHGARSVQSRPPWLHTEQHRRATRRPPSGDDPISPSTGTHAVFPSGRRRSEMGPRPDTRAPSPQPAW